MLQLTKPTKTETTKPTCNIQSTSLGRDRSALPLPHNHLFQSTARFSHELIETLTDRSIHTASAIPFTADNSFALRFSQLVAGRQFIDLCCGKPDYSYHAKWAAWNFGASEYIGVDNCNVTEAVTSDRVWSPDLKLRYRKMDVLDFLREFQSSAIPPVIYMSGMEPRNERASDTIQYQSDCCMAIRDILGAGGAVVTGSGTSHFHFERIGFRASESYGKHIIYELTA